MATERQDTGQTHEEGVVQPHRNYRRPLKDFLEQGEGREGKERTVLAQAETHGQGFTSTDEHIKCLGRQALLPCGRVVLFVGASWICALP